MNVSDLYLYAGLVGGWLVGRRWPHRGPWLGRASLAAVVVLVAFLLRSPETFERDAAASS